MNFFKPVLALLLLSVLVHALASGTSVGYAGGPVTPSPSQAPVYGFVVPPNPTEEPLPLITPRPSATAQVVRTVNVDSPQEPNPSTDAIPTLPTGAGVKNGASSEKQGTLVAPEYFCQDLATVNDRVKCRINLPQKNEHLLVLPEECRGLTKIESRLCYLKYDTLQSCRFKETDELRTDCVRKIVGAEKSPRAQITSCISDNGKGYEWDSASPLADHCKKKVSERAFDVIKYRLNTLQARAEAFKGQNEALVVQFISDVEQAKLQFNAAPSIEAKKTVLLSVNSLWNAFNKNIREPRR